MMYMYILSVAISLIKCRHTSARRILYSNEIYAIDFAIVHTDTIHSQTDNRALLLFFAHFFHLFCFTENIDVIRLSIIGHIFNLMKKKVI